MDRVLTVFDEQIDKLLLNTFLVPITEDTLLAETIQNFKPELEDFSKKVKKAKTPEDIKKLSEEDEFRRKKFQDFTRATGVQVGVVESIVNRHNNGSIQMSELFNTALDELKIYFKTGDVLRDAAGVIIWVVAFYVMQSFFLAQASASIAISQLHPIVRAVFIELVNGVVISGVCNIITEKLVGFRDDNGVINGLMSLPRRWLKMSSQVYAIVLAIIPLINLLINKVNYIFNKTYVKLTGVIDKPTDEFFGFLRQVSGLINGIALVGSSAAMLKKV